MHLTFLPWDDRLACMHLIYHVWGPVLNHPVDPYIAWALYFADPALLPTDFDEIREIVHRLAWGKPLKDAQRRLVERALRLKPPKEFKEVVMRNYKKLQQKWDKLEGYLKEVVSRAHGERVLEKEVRVFPSINLKGSGGSAYIDEVGVSLSHEWNDWILRTFAHELTHIFLNRDRRFKELLRKLSDKYGIPAHEAHVEALTNIFWWRAGKAEKMFHNHYMKWKELEEFEKRYWSAVGKWWKEGGDLYRMVYKSFL